MSRVKKMVWGLMIGAMCLSNAQDLPTIVPLSPNAAEITKYGEIPVGHFTGVPSIKIPIYTINEGSLTLPLSLNYHAGGNKVESVASWVGLGWSLGIIPSISRRVQGIPDERGGYFNKYMGYTIRDLIEESEVVVDEKTYNSFRNALVERFADSEPDIFYYNIIGESGKFFYNQEIEDFITSPKSNIKISRKDDNTFTIIDQNGVKYLFNITETSEVGTDNSIQNTWYASKIESYDKKGAIRITYQQERLLTKTLNVVTKYHYLGGHSGNGFPPNKDSIMNNNLSDVMVPDSILFENGYVKFNRSSNYREDLNGGKSLSNVSVFSKNNNLIKRYVFTHNYVNGGVSSGKTTHIIDDSYSRKWLFLDKVENYSNDSLKKLTHLFTYDKTTVPKSRRSAAQDYWGYYNGHDSNSDLIPTYYLPYSNTQISGADRKVNPKKSRFGILTKITYPTGGYTEFDFENNDASTDDLPSQYVNDYLVLSGDDYFNEDKIPNGIDTFSKTFTINNPPDKFLNNMGLAGGAYTNFEFSFPGCDLSSGKANPCARFTVSGANINTIDITVEGKTVYLPNGTYTMTASFYQPNFPNYQDFTFISEWQKMNPNQNDNKYAGGLRIKEIRNYAHPTAQPIIKKYKYVSDLNSTESSGDIFGFPGFNHSEEINFYKNPAVGGVSATKLLRIRSVANMQQINHSGSFVGYKKVYEEIHNSSETNLTEYQFSHQKDIISNRFPYPPPQSKEVFRGLLEKKLSYKKTPSGYKLIQKKSFEYSDLPYRLNYKIPQYSTGIKWGSLMVRIDGFSQCTTCLEYLNFAQNITPYHVLGGWNRIHSEETVNYYDDTVASTKVKYFYDNEDHLLKTRLETTDSQGNQIEQQNFYPQDLPNDFQTDKLIIQNRIGKPIANTINKINTNGNIRHILSKKTTFKYVNGLVLPNELKGLKGTDDLDSLEVLLTYHRYDSSANPLEVSQKDGMHTVYLYGYSKQYPIAKIENATFTEVASALGVSENALENFNETHIGQINGLRAQKSEWMITTYTHIPLVGVKTVTDPRGRRTNYEYDDFNRLKHIRGPNNEILEAYDYKYKK